MNFVNINKIYYNKKEYSIKAILLLDKLKLKIYLNSEDRSLQLSWLKFKFKDKDGYVADRNVYLTDTNNINYVCIGCNVVFENCQYLMVDFNCIYNNFLKNYDNILTNKIEFLISYHKKYFNDITYLEIEHLEIKHLENNIYINKVSNNYNDKKIFLKLVIKNNNKVEKKELEKLLYEILELIYLIIGHMPKIEQRSFYCGNKKIDFYYKIAKKYYQNFKSGMNYKLLSSIKVITSDVISKFQKFRENTKNLYDIFMFSQSGLLYKELNNNMLVQIMEGTYRTLNESSNSKKKRLCDILKYYFIGSKYEIFREVGEKDESIFLYKAKNHRNYFSHLNTRDYEQIFEDIVENNYAEFILTLRIRIIYLEYLEIEIDQEKLELIVNSINN